MILFGTKAETLDRLRPIAKTCSVLDLLYFSVGEWENNAPAIYETVLHQFQMSRLAVRSSALGEDSGMQSMAGVYKSVLDVDGSTFAGFQSAIRQVTNSYKKYDPANQILVQPMLSSVIMSGVIMTRELTTGAPYYVINYDDESGKTDVITGGTGVNKTLAVHHGTQLHFIKSSRVTKLILMIHELEDFFGKEVPLDIEFAMTEDGTLHLLQVRQVPVQRIWQQDIQTHVTEILESLCLSIVDYSIPRSSVAGDSTIFGQMPDWNPAELIGTHPRPLAVSLFRFLITDDVWQRARSRMGYRAVLNEPLMVVLAGYPYIDVRNSFNSFLPEGIDFETETSLINAWLQRLAAHPEYHDKVEFNVAQTIVDFTFEDDFRENYDGVLTSKQYDVYLERLRNLTKRNVGSSPNSTLGQALSQIKHLEALQDEQSPSDISELRRALQLLYECRELGTLPFSMLARHGFIAEALLRSAVRRNALGKERLDQFKNSLTTIAGQMGQDLFGVIEGQFDRDVFLRRYGHLRPGTFDILSPRYDQREDLFIDEHHAEVARGTEQVEFSLTTKESRDLKRLLVEQELPLESNDLLAYAREAILAREYSKFVFSKHLSDSIELIARWGEGLSLSRDDLSYLALSDLSDFVHAPVLFEPESHFRSLIENRRTQSQVVRGLKLGHIIRDVVDLYVVPFQRGPANFVTSKSIEREATFIDNRMIVKKELFNKIVCIESADPGFDWIFTKGIAGLVTKYGGANSHMTIRCAELNIPAAIGVGDQVFERLVKATKLELRCAEKIVRPVYG